MQVIYIKSSGKITSIIPNESNHKLVFEDFGSEYIDSLGSIHNSGLNFSDINSYRVVNGRLIELDEIEKHELQTLGYFLTNEERLERELLDKLQPSEDEIKKAENTIEILELLSEVL